MLYADNPVIVSHKHGSLRMMIEEAMKKCTASSLAMSDATTKIMFLHGTDTYANNSGIRRQRAGQVHLQLKIIVCIRWGGASPKHPISLWRTRDDCSKHEDSTGGTCPFEWYDRPAADLRLKVRRMLPAEAVEAVLDEFMRTVQPPRK